MTKTTLRKAQAADERFRIVVESTATAMLMVDGSGSIEMVNAAAENLFGYPRAELLVRSIEALLPNALRIRQFDRFAEPAFGAPVGAPLGSPLGVSPSMTPGKTTADEQLFAQRKDGSRLPVGVALNLVETEKGITILASITDQSTRRQSEQLWKHYACIIASSEDAIISKTIDGIILSWNPASERIFGYSALEAIGKPMTMLFPPDRLFEERLLLNRLASGERITRYETVRLRKDGSSVFVSVTLSPVMDEFGRIVGASKMAHDITAHRKIEDEVRAMAFSDPLTNLPNRRLLIDRLEHALALSERSCNHGAVLMVDLDEFKGVNDTLGHDAGDSLLRQVAFRLLTSVRACDTVARIGGDEFVILLEDLNVDAATAKAQTLQIGDKVLARLNEPYRLASQDHACTVSIGAALFGRHRQSVDEVLKRADIALYIAKKEGRHTLRLDQE